MVKTKLHSIDGLFTKIEFALRYETHTFDTKLPI